MQINDLKSTFKDIISSYFMKDENGNYILEQKYRRPLLMYGPPGIGKTDIASQIAREKDIGFISISMTHHTRQSAIGLPAIKTITINGQEKEVTEYTLSEILALVYNYIEETGKKEGIMFIDEFNTLSPSLEPAMLQFLQEKTFGGNKLPEGYVILAAGNHSKDNHGVKELDGATLDRFLIFDLEADIDTFLEYAREHDMDDNVIRFLRSYPDYLCKYEYKGEDSEIVTPRAWEELSILIKSFDKSGFEIRKELIRSVIKSDEIAESFFSEYCIFTEQIDDDPYYEIMYKGIDVLKDRYKKEEFDYGRRWDMSGKLLEKTMELEKLTDESSQVRINMCVKNVLQFIIKYFSDAERNFYMYGVLGSNVIARAIYGVADKFMINEMTRLFYEG